jgi:predicted phosphodiesterase
MGKILWTPEKLEVLKAYLENPNYSYANIAKKMNMSIDSIEHAKRRYGFENIKEPIENDELNYFEHYSGMINYLKEELDKTKSLSKINISSKKIGDTLNIQLTDWHVGRIVKDEYGKIIYDVNTFKQMTSQFIYELLKLLDKYISKGTPISDVKIFSTGDLCDGLGIFATQATVSEFAPPFQVMIATEVIQKIILSLLDRKLNVKFYGVKGNHGELRINGKNTDPNANWDLMLYLMLDFWARNIVKSKNLSISYSELDYLNLNNRGWNYHLRHIAPNQSETASGKAKFLGWAKQHKFDVLIYGHFHHWGVWDRSKITIIRGGALTAGDEFAETLAEESEPIQLIWGCNEKRPITFIYPLDLGQKEKRN